LHGSQSVSKQSLKSRFVVGSSRNSFSVAETGVQAFT
jgi:hypothetical protein